MTCTPCSGSFAQVEGTKLDGGKWFEVRYEADSVNLVVVTEEIENNIYLPRVFRWAYVSASGQH